MTFFKQNRFLFLFVILFLAVSTTTVSISSCGSSSTTTGDDDDDTVVDDDETSTAFGQPQGLTASGYTQRAYMDWTGVSGAASYNLYHSTTAGVTIANGTKVPGLTSSAYLHSNLTNDTVYYYIVTAVNSSGTETEASAEASATPSDTWTTSVLDTDGPGQRYCTIDTDSNNKVYIAYENGAPIGNSKSVGVINNSTGSFVIEEANSTAPGQREASLELSSTDSLHIAFYDTDNFDLVYTTRSSSTTAWTATTVDSDGTTGQSPYLALDSSGNAHIVYFDNTNSSVNYATNASGSWVAETVASGATPSFLDLIVNSSNVVHIAYSDLGLQYVTGSSGSWSTPVEVDDGSIFGISLALDSSEKLHISYQEFNNRELYHATNASGSWVIEEISDSGITLGDYTSMIIDASDNMFIAFHKLGASGASDTQAKIASSFSSGVWTIDTIDAGGGGVTDNTGEFISMALDGNNKLHVCYWNDRSGVADLKYGFEGS